MMRIPYVKIMEIRSLKDYLDKSDIPKISKWFYNKAYNFQCKPILKLLKKSKNQINHIYSDDIIEFSRFVMQASSNHGAIRGHHDTVQGDVYCSLDFIELHCSLKASDFSPTIRLEQYGYSKDIRKELISLDTGINSYKEIYDTMIDFIIRYILEGEKE